MKLVSWNIDCEGDYEGRLPQILSEINGENADVICLQEVKYGSYGSIREFFPGYTVILDKKVEYNRMYGEMILSRLPVEGSSYIAFTRSPNIRGLTLYTLDCGLVIGTTHLENVDKYNTFNTTELKNMVSKYDRFILAGDFNYFDKEPLSYDQAKLGNTFAKPESEGRADRVYYRGVGMLGSEKKVSKYSDHCRIIVSFDI